MPKKGANISLSSYDDIFETDESRADSQLERVQKIPISDLKPFQNHPFKVVDDEAMLRTTESIAQFGVLTPLIARPLVEGGYEIISGHRRAHAAAAAGLTEVPVIVRDMTDDEAVVLMLSAINYRISFAVTEYSTHGYAICPRCGFILDRDYQEYCTHCGQHLKWGKR